MIRDADEVIQDHTGPRVFTIPLPPSNVLSIEDTQCYREGSTGLESARDMAYWDEQSGEWLGVPLSTPLLIDRHCPAVLLRRQDAFYICGVGEALQYLTRESIRRRLAGVKMSPTHPVYGEATIGSEVSSLL